MPATFTVSTNKKPGADWVGDRAKDHFGGTIKWHSRPRAARRQ
jgi:hypothetical protein